MPASYLTDPSVGRLGIIEILSLGAQWTLIGGLENRQGFVVGQDRMLRHLSPPLTTRLPLRDRPELVVDLDALFAKLPAHETEP